MASLNVCFTDFLTTNYCIGQSITPKSLKVDIDTTIPEIEFPLFLLSRITHSAIKADVLVYWLHYTNMEVWKNTFSSLLSATISRAYELIKANTKDGIFYIGKAGIFDKSFVPLLVPTVITDNYFEIIKGINIRIASEVYNNTDFVSTGIVKKAIPFYVNAEIPIRGYNIKPKIIIENKIDSYTTPNMLKPSDADKIKELVRSNIDKII